MKDSKIWYFRNICVPLIIGTFLILIMTGIRVFLDRKDSSSGTDSVNNRMTVPLEDLKRSLFKILEGQGVQQDFQNGEKRNKEVWQFHVPADLPVPSLHLIIQEEISRVGAKVIFAEHEPFSGLLSLQIGWQDSCYLKINLLPHNNLHEETGKIAILIDDFGDRWDYFVKSFLDLKSNITISILPGRRLSTKIAREIVRRGYEIILHLPMEPLNSTYDNDSYIILREMSREQIKEVIQRSLEDVPGVFGINNHMGSAVTSDEQAITKVLEVIKKKNLYFIDSRTISSSVAYEMARVLGVKCGKRDIFFDVNREKEAIRRSLWALARKAKTNGFSIGVGHCQPATLEILKEEIPKIRARGYRFVFLSEVVR